MGGFAGVFFQMGMMNTDFLFLQIFFGAEGNFNAPGAVNRFIKLCDLVAFGQIRVKIMFARKGGIFVNFAPQREPRLYGKFHGAFRQYREYPGLARTARANGGIGFGVFPYAVGARAKQFGFAGQLDVNFQSNNRFKFGCHGYLSPKLL